jgi:uncharacterized protein YndB with AHSA1/START domain
VNDDDESVRVERRVAAPASVVFRYLTEGHLWCRWQGVAATLDATHDGLFHMQMADGSVASGRFVEIVPDKRVVFTWGWTDGRLAVTPGSTTVEIDLVPDGAGTLIRLTHRGLPPAAREHHHVGWRHYVARLAVCSTGSDPGPDRGPMSHDRAAEHVAQDGPPV